MTGHWASSTRRSRLPADWKTRVTRTKKRAQGLCEAEEHADGCDGYGSQCDHHERGDDHRLVNLRWLSEPCHEAKTQAEAQAAAKAKRAAARRPAERHPIEVI